MSGFSSYKSKASTLFSSIALLSLLFIAMLFDLRGRQVPQSITLGGLIGSGIFAIFYGLWAPIALTAALIFLSDFNHRARRIGFAIILAVFAALLQPETVWLCILILGTWLLWELGGIGGADVKLLISALLVLQDPWVLLPIFLAGGLQGLLAALKKKKDIPFVVSIFCGSLIFAFYPYF